MPSRRGLAGSLFAVVLLAGCAGSGSPTVGSSAAGSRATVGSSTAPGATAISACDLLTDADIKAVTGLGVAKKEAKVLSGVSENGCDWTLDDQSASEVQLGAVDPGGRRFFDAYYAPFNSPLPGVGDAAITTDSKAVMAVKGDAAVLVDYIEFPAAHPDYAVRLLQAALTHLP